MTGTFLTEGDKAAAAVAVAPRVSLADMEARIGAEYQFLASEAVTALGSPAVPGLSVLSVCVLVLDTGWTVIGRSAPASPANFDAALGRKLARDDAIRQLWPLFGFALKERLRDEAAAFSVAP